MPEQVRGSSASEKRHRHDPDARHNVEWDRKAGAARHEAGKHDERKKTAQRVPVGQKEEPLKPEGEKLRQAPSKTKEHQRVNRVRQQDRSGDSNEHRNPRAKDIDEPRRQASKDAVIRWQPGNKVESVIHPDNAGESNEKRNPQARDVDGLRRQASKHTEARRQPSEGAQENARPQHGNKDLEKPRREAEGTPRTRHHSRNLKKSRHESGKGYEKQKASEKVEKPSHDGSMETPLGKLRAATGLERAKSLQLVLQDATDAQRPAPKSNEAVDIRRPLVIHEAPRPQESQGDMRSLRLRKLSTITEVMPGSFSAYESTESTELTVYEAPKEAPIVPAAVEPPRALFHIDGPLINININFNLWGN